MPQKNAACIAQVRGAPLWLLLRAGTGASAGPRSKRLHVLPLPLELRWHRLHRQLQVFGGAAEVDSQQRPERIMKRVRHYSPLVVVQVQSDARRRGGDPG
eukprot:scaffold37817_cov75-Phaeocystis_antarctica.AAC.1